MSGWQPHQGIWHYFPLGPFHKLSACETLMHDDRPLVPEPASTIWTCQKCVKMMRVIVAKLENRKA